MQYSRGDLATVASANALLMTALSDDDRLARTADVVADGAGVDEVIHALCGVTSKALSVSGLPDFALLLYEDGQQLRLLVRGRLVVELAYSDGRTQQVQGDRARTWREELVDDVIRVAVYDATAQAAASSSNIGWSKHSWPLGDGMVWASRVEWELKTPRTVVGSPANKRAADTTEDNIGVPSVTSVSSSAPTPPSPAEEPAPIQTEVIDEAAA